MPDPMAVTPERSAVLGSVARRLAASRPGHPLRVGIDGVCGSGKTTFSRARRIRHRGRPGRGHRRLRRVPSCSRPPLPAGAGVGPGVLRRRLRPRLPGGTRPAPPRAGRRPGLCRPVRDLASDARIDDETARAPADAIVLFAATFIQRGRLRDLWDEVIYLDVPQEAAIARGVARDAGALGRPGRRPGGLRSPLHGGLQALRQPAGPVRAGIDPHRQRRSRRAGHPAAALGRPGNGVTRPLPSAACMP
jgi:uridine kinase